MNAPPNSSSNNNTTHNGGQPQPEVSPKTVASAAASHSKSNLDALATLAANSVTNDSLSPPGILGNNHSNNGFAGTVAPTTTAGTTAPSNTSAAAMNPQLYQQLSGNPQWQQLLSSMQQANTSLPPLFAPTSAQPPAVNFFAGQHSFPFATPLQAQLQSLLASINQPNASAATNGTTNAANGALYNNPVNTSNPELSVMPPSFPSVTTPYATTTTATATTASKTPVARSSNAMQQGTSRTKPIDSALTDIRIAPAASHDVDLSTDDEQATYHGTKQELKRAANRRSAQLSRKRKKLFLEELRDENDILRRKEQILKNIPDLVVVFDSSGKVHFVSESIRSFLDITVEDLLGSSFWNRLCDDSTRRLKAAFMDSLAERPENADTVCLGTTGHWDVLLMDTDRKTTKPVSLHGVVHFAGDRPECVCSIRARSETATVTANHTKMTHQRKHSTKQQEQEDVAAKDAVRISDSGQSSTGEDSESGNEIPQTS